MMEARSTRRGVALFVTLVILVTGCAILSLSLSSLGQYTHRAARERRREALLRTCRSAASEAAARTWASAEEVGSPCFERMRWAVEKQQPAVLEMAARELGLLGEMSTASGFSLEGPLHVRIEPTADGRVNPWEGDGELHLVGKVSGGADLRTFSGSIGFRVSLLTPPRPFDRMLLFVRDPSRLLGPRGGIREANDTIDGSLAGLTWVKNAGIPMLAVQIRQALARDLAPALRTGLQRVLTRLDRLGATTHVMHPLRPWRFPARVSVLLTSDAIGSFDLSRLGRASARVREASQKVQDCSRDMMITAQELWTDLCRIDLLERYVDDLEALAGALAESLEVYWQLERELVWRGGDAVLQMEPYWHQLDPDVLRRRAFATVSVGDPWGALVEMNRSARRLGGTLSGVVHLSPTRGALRIRGSLEGIDRLLVVTDSPVEVEELSCAGGRLTIVTSSDLRVTGRVEAFLVARGTTAFSDDAVVRGGLVTDRLIVEGRARGSALHTASRSYLSWDPRAIFGTLDPSALRVALDVTGRGLYLDIGQPGPWRSHDELPSAAQTLDRVTEEKKEARGKRE